MPGLSSAILCLALTVYNEARGEPIAGQYAVAYVTLNRAKQRSKTICEVIKEPYQYSWYKNNYQLVPKSGVEWETSLKVARTSYTMRNNDNLFSGAAYFHGKEIRPSWTKSMKQIATFGNHIFYTVEHKPTAKKFPYDRIGAIVQKYTPKDTPNIK
jgi:N-acetylmuramoyl-L-alanine amidase